MQVELSIIDLVMQANQSTHCHVGAFFVPSAKN